MLSARKRFKGPEVQGARKGAVGRRGRTALGVGELCR